ncbi:MAG: (2Fe-2S)-binding protein [Burkholderiales bacterium]|nr:(2Fe-2S)-binding protein [Burkholderiales bacterium]
MYVCLCAAVTDRQIREVASQCAGGDFRTLCRNLGIAQQCGKCAPAVRLLFAGDHEPTGAPPPALG